MILRGNLQKPEVLDNAIWSFWGAEEETPTDARLPKICNVAYLKNLHELESLQLQDFLKRSEFGKLNAECCSFKMKKDKTTKLCVSKLTPLKRKNVWSPQFKGLFLISRN